MEFRNEQLPSATERVRELGGKARTVISLTIPMRINIQYSLS